MVLKQSFMIEVVAIKCVYSQHFTQHPASGKCSVTSYYSTTLAEIQDAVIIVPLSPMSQAHINNIYSPTYPYHFKIKPIVELSFPFYG